MNCVRCSQPIQLGAAHCGSCGAPLDANGDGVPDALEQMIEDKARAMIAADRERQEREQAAAEQRRQEDAARAALAAKRQELADARRRLEATRATKHRVWAMGGGTVFASLLLGLIIGLPSSCIGEAVTDRAVWGDTLCPQVCDDCTGPGRVFMWSRTRNGSRSTITRALCHNPRVDVDQLRWTDVTDENRFADIELSGWWRYPLSLLAVMLLGLLVLPFWFPRISRRAAEREAGQLQTLIARLERELPPERETAAEPYR